MNYIEDVRHYANLGFVFTFRGDSITVMYFPITHTANINPVYLGDNIEHAFGACELMLLGDN